MLKNYIKIAIRNITRSKVYSLINILGLTLGITCSSLLFLLVIDELSYDDMYTKKDQIYRVIEVDNSEESTRYYGQTSPPVGRTLVEEYSEVTGSTNLYKFGGQIVFSKDDTKFDERNYFFADSAFFNVFNVDWIDGDPNTALSQPKSMVIDEDWAHRLFGDENAIGKEVNLGGEDMSIITGVFKKLPQNSHLQFKILLSVPRSEDFKNFLSDWSDYGAYTYVMLKENMNGKALDTKIPDFIARHFKPEQKRNFYLQSLNDIHFESKDIEYGTEDTHGQKAYVYVFIAIGFFMLIIACINYVNLSTARSLHRGKEIGIRKVSGAFRSQLIAQFLTESTVIALISLVLSVGLVDLLLPYFNQLTDKQFVFNLDSFSSVFSILFGVTLVVGLLSGGYPALLLSRLKPADILKGAMSTGNGSAVLRKTLVITQFTLSIVMIIATIIAFGQLNYIQNKSLGFDKDQTLVIDINSRNVRSRFETMKTEFAKSPYVKGVAVSSRVPGEWKNIRQVYTNKVGEQDSMRVNFIGFDKDIINLYGMQMAAGSNFSGNVKSDSLHVLINETAVSALNLDNPIGKFIEIKDGRGGVFQIIGVVKDFNFESLHHKIAPVILGFRANPFQSIDYFSLKFDPNHIEEAIAHATEVHNTFDTNTPIEYHFLDEQWALFYKDDSRAENLFAIGASITIFIACLGLFGLASFIIQKRTKEIGVRKVLGASVFQLFILLSKTFVAQVGIAFIIAVPIAWFFMSEWLNTFAFKFELGAGEFLIAGAITLLIALVSVSYRVLYAASLNPADTLKTE
jgi:putative ABC transport system permease protein